jgi:hypothetical protein
MVVRMCAFAGRVRSIDPRIVGLLRRSLMVAGLLFGFVVAGSAVAHADGRPTPPPKPSLGIGLRTLRGLPIPVAPILRPITSVAAHTVGTVRKTLAPVTRTLAPVTKPLTSITTGLTTTVVRTVAPIIEPAVAVTTPILQPVMPVLPPPPPGRSSGGGGGTTPLGAPNPALTDPTTTLPVTDPVALPPLASTGPAQAVVPPSSGGTFDGILVLPKHSGSEESPAIPTPAPPPDNDGGGPIADVTGGASSGASGPSGQVSGISRPSFGTAADQLSTTGVRPGTGPPKWWLFDPHHHPS